MSPYRRRKQSTSPGRLGCVLVVVLVVAVLLLGIANLMEWIT